MTNLTLSNLPYSKNDLEPYISQETLEFHHGKHHATYVKNANDIINADQNLQNLSVAELVKKSYNNDQKLYNNIAQHYNHDFFWKSMDKNCGGEPNNEKVKKLINESFNSYQEFYDLFKQTSLTTFGSGWVWLVFNKNTNKAEIRKSFNAENFLHDDNIVALLVMDVWEHSYYIDFRNDRGKYTITFLDNLLNWNFVEENLNNIS